MTGTIPYKESQIHYTTYGTGPSLLLCFHGFGEATTSFQELGSALGNTFTLLALDLPFHGNTNWRGELHLSPDDLWQIIDILPPVRELASDLNSSQIGLLGYSMGGRVCLSLFQTKPNRVKEIILIAPDGLRANPWYVFATQTEIGNKVFRNTMEDPQWVYSLVTPLRKAGLLNESVFKFNDYYLKDATRRMQVYRVWTTLRNFKPNLPLIITRLREKPVAVSLIYGKFDRIITVPYGQRFAKQLPGIAHLHIIEAGHQLLQSRYIGNIATYILSRHS